MIRFACPSCEATYTVAPQYAGRSSVCKKCGTRFQIPDAPAEDSAAVEPPPPPVEASPPPPSPAEEAPASTVELDPCPKCQARLTVYSTDVGREVQCPYCQTIFAGTVGAASANVGIAAPDEEPVAAEVVDDDVEINPCPKCKASLTVDASSVGGQVECPYCQTVYVATKLETSSNRRAAPVAVVAMGSKPDSAPPPPPKKEKDTYSAKFPDDEDDPRSRRRSRDDDDDDDEEDRPRRKRAKKKKRPRRSYEESEATMCLVLTLLGWFICGLILFVAKSKCEQELDRIDSGRVDPSNRSMVSISLTLCKVGIVLMVIGVVMMVLFTILGFLGVCGGAAAVR